MARSMCAWPPPWPMFTGDLSQALGIGTIEPLVQTGVFALHDRLWERRSPALADDLRRAAHWLVYGGVKARS